MFQVTLRENEVLKFPNEFSKYKYVKTIGQCRHGVVIQALHIPSQKYFACKILLRKFFQTEDQLQMLEHETRIQHFLNHKNIIKNYETLFFEEHIVLVLDYCEYGDLFSYRSKTSHLTINKKISIMKEVLEGLHYLHTKNIVHRDIKLDNIFISNDHVAKIGDYGCCEVITENKKRIFDQKGTIEYASPETLKNQIKDPMKCDIWSFGITFYAFMLSVFPWFSQNDSDLINEICNRRIEIPYHLPRAISDLIMRCTEPDEQKRPTTEELLKDPLFLSSTLMGKRRISEQKIFLKDSFTLKSKMLVKPRKFSIPSSKEIQITPSVSQQNKFKTIPFFWNKENQNSNQKLIHALKNNENSNGNLC